MRYFCNLNECKLNLIYSSDSKAELLHSSESHDASEIILICWLTRNLIFLSYVQSYVEKWLCCLIMLWKPWHLFCDIIYIYIYIYIYIFKIELYNISLVFTVTICESNVKRNSIIVAGAWLNLLFNSALNWCIKCTTILNSYQSKALENLRQNIKSLYSVIA